MTRVRVITIKTKGEKAFRLRRREKRRRERVSDELLIDARVVYARSTRPRTAAKTAAPPAVRRDVAEEAGAGVLPEAVVVALVRTSVTVSDQQSGRKGIGSAIVDEEKEGKRTNSG